MQDFNLIGRHLDEDLEFPNLCDRLVRFVLFSRVSDGAAGRATLCLVKAIQLDTFIALLDVFSDLAEAELVPFALVRLVLPVDEAHNRTFSVDGGVLVLATRFCL